MVPAPPDLTSRPRSSVARAWLARNLGRLRSGFRRSAGACSDGRRERQRVVPTRYGQRSLSSPDRRDARGCPLRPFSTFEGRGRCGLQFDGAGDQPGAGPRPQVAAQRQDPFPLYAWLRDHEPVHWSESLNAWVVTRYGDVVEVFNRPETFSADRFRKIDERYASHRPAVRAVAEVLGHWLVFRDPPDHDRLRGLLQSSFTPQAARVEPRAHPGDRRRAPRSRRRTRHDGLHPGARLSPPCDSHRRPDGCAGGRHRADQDVVRSPGRVPRRGGRRSRQFHRGERRRCRAGRLLPARCSASASAARATT